MPQKRFLGASLALHAAVFTIVVLAGEIHIHGRPLPPPEDLVKIVDVATPRPRPVPRKVESAIAYPHRVAPTPRPTPTPRPKLAARPQPKPTLEPKELARYRKKLPELAHKPLTAAQKIAERLKKLGLDPSAAASMDAAVRFAINSGGDRIYRPTTPGATRSATSSPMASATGSSQLFALPQAWATPSSPLQAFLDRVLPPDRGYDYQLTSDASGDPELRIRYRNGNFVQGGDLIFVETWNPGAAASPSVDVQVLDASGKPLGHFAFTMLAPPGDSLDTFVQAMAGTAMLQWVQNGGR